MLRMKCESVWNICMYFQFSTPCSLYKSSLHLAVPFRPFPNACAQLDWEGVYSGTVQIEASEGKNTGVWVCREVKWIKTSMHTRIFTANESPALIFHRLWLWHQKRWLIRESKHHCTGHRKPAWSVKRWLSVITDSLRPGSSLSFSMNKEKLQKHKALLQRLYRSSLTWNALFSISLP